MSLDEKEKLDMFVQNGAEIIGPISSTAIGFLFAGPIGAFIGAAGSAPLTNALKKLGTEISDKVMAPREKARVAYAYALSLEKIEKRLSQGDCPREDGFFNHKQSDRSSAETILEGILIKVKNEHEEKKIKYYSEFLANLTFDDSVDFNQSITYLKIIDRMSYQQLCILSYFKQMSKVEFKDWSSFFINNSKAQIYLDFYFELVELFDFNVLKQYGSMKLGGPGNGELSLLGEKLFELMKLSNIDNSDTLMILDKIKSINDLTISN